VRLLLDTHTFLWYSEGSPKLSAPATGLLTDPAHELYLSTASVWELAIKVGLKKLSLSLPFLPFIPNTLLHFGIYLLPISLDDCEGYRQLPFPIPKHRDPFDRMIITHALRNGLSIVGCDVLFDPYGVTRLW
jgi:PIN domain nuclease of toxin-antitoxin system